MAGERLGQFPQAKDSAPAPGQGSPFGAGAVTSAVLGPSGANKGGGGSPAANGGSGSPATGAVTGEGGAAGGGSGSPSLPSPTDPLGHLSAPKQPYRPAPVRPGFLDRDRDWVITLECRADRAVLQLNAQTFSLDELSAGADGLLPRTLRQLIDRRQATVPAGVPPYRPILRFLVYPGGLRSYYRAYPALEGLNHPMTRTDVDPIDEERLGRTSR